MFPCTQPSGQHRAKQRTRSHPIYTGGTGRNTMAEVTSARAAMSQRK